LSLRAHRRRAWQSLFGEGKYEIASLPLPVTEGLRSYYSRNAKDRKSLRSLKCYGIIQSIDKKFIRDIMGMFKNVYIYLSFQGQNF